MKGNEILLSENPRGRRTEGIVSGTPKPGTFMTLVAATEPDGTGRYTWEPYNRAADGNRALVAILLEDHLQGKGPDDAYVNGDRCFLYFPLPGDELNARVADAAGTADDVAIGDLFIIDDGTGKLNATTGTPEAEVFQALETITDPAADYLLHGYYTGY